MINKIFTREEIPDDSLRIATNCYNSDYKCTRKLAEKCKAEFYELYNKCPKNNKQGEVK